MIATVEEHYSTVILPRLIAGGADLGRVEFLKGLTLPGGIGDLGTEAKARGLGFLFLDPLHALFDSNHDFNRSQPANYVLTELGQMAEVAGLTVIGTLHTNRSLTTAARGKVPHQIEFLRVARSAVLLGRAKDDEEQERTLIHFKHNYSAQALAQKLWITTKDVETDEGPAETPVLNIDGPSEATESDLLGEEAEQGDPQAIRQARTKAGQCRAIIEDIWRQAGKPDELPASAFKERVTDAGFSRDSITPAKRALGIDSYTIGGPPPQWIWRFPPHED